MRRIVRIAGLMIFVLHSVLAIAWNTPNLASPSNGATVWTGVEFDWYSVPGSLKYQFQIDTADGFDSPALFSVTKNYINSSSSNSDTEQYMDNLYFGTVYYWRVRAWIPGDTSAWSPVRWVSTRDYVNLDSPSNGATTYAGVTLDWYSHPGVDYYDMQADTSATFDSPALKQYSKTYINSSSSNNDTKHYLDNIFFGTQYHWRVRVRNAVDTSGWSEVRWFATRDYVSLDSPSNGATTYAGVTLDWYSHPGVDYYDMQADTSATFDSPALRQYSKTYINSNSSNNDTEHYLDNIFFGTQYHWRVRVRNAVDTSGWSEVRWFATRDYVSLDSPSNGATTYAGVTLDWYSHPGVDYYDMQADTSATFDSPALRQYSKAYINSSSSNNDTEHYLDNIFFGEVYHWRVRARNAVDTCNWSTVRWISIRDYVNLAYPANGQLNIPVSGITLDWYSHPGIDYYQLQIDTTNLFNSFNLQEYTKTYINSSSGNSDTRHSTGALMANTVYFWRVRVLNAVDTSSWTTRAFSTGSDPIIYPEIPVLLSPGDEEHYLDVNLAFDWDDAVNATGYVFLIDTVPGFSNPVEWNTDTSGLELAGLDIDRRYYWKVRSSRDFIFSEWSETRSFTTGIRPPLLLQPGHHATNIPLTSVIFDWATSPRAVYYRFQLSETEDFSLPVSNDTVVATDTIMSGLAPATRYFWRVKASDGAYDSQWSNTHIFNTEPQNMGFFVNISVFLQGPFSGNFLSNSLNQDHLLPLTHPYGQAPWNVAGNWSVDSIPSAAVVDWILLEVRDTPSPDQAVPSTTAGLQPAFVTTTGQVVALDGASFPQFNFTISSGLFIVISHRNHVAVMSADSLTASGNTYTWQFLTSPGQYYGGVLGCRELATGIWGMAGGDGFQDNQINNKDKNDIWAVQAGESGYKSGDFNFDGQVNNSDKNDIWVPNTGIGGQVPQ